MTDSRGIIFALVSVYLIALLPPPTRCDSGDKSETDDCQGKENSYLWKIDASPPIYLFGTMHVPYTKLWEHIPDNAKIAFSSSEDLCVELRLSDSNTVSELAKCQRLPKGTAISELLSVEVRTRIKNYLDRIRHLLPNWLEMSDVSSLFGGGGQAYSDLLFNAMVGDWEQKRPIWILYTLSSLTEENIRLRKIPLLDLFMDNAAEGLGKKVQAVETARDQCRPLNRLSNEQVELALKVQLDFLEPTVMEDSQGPVVSSEKDIHAYRCGDFASIVSSTPFLPLPSLDNITATSSWLSDNEIDTLKNTEKYLWGQMVVRRNRRMTKAIEALLKRPRNVTYFFALGAGHLLSDKNVVDRLKRKGYAIQHITVSQHLEGPSLPNNILELGHPELVPQLMPILPETDSHRSKYLLPTLSDETLAEIWKKYVVYAPQIQTPTIVSSYTTPSAPQTTQQIRNTRANIRDDSTLSEQEIKDEMWQKEVAELFSLSNLSEEATTNSAQLLSCAHCIFYVILTGLLSLFLNFS